MKMNSVSYIVSTVLCVLFAAVALLMMLSIDSIERYVAALFCILVCILASIAFGLFAFVYYGGDFD